MRYTILTVLSAAILGLGVAEGAPIKETGSPEKLSLQAFWVNLNNPGGKNTGTLDFSIERWSTHDEVARLRDTLLTKGEDALLTALQRIKPRVGFVRGSKGLGWDLYYASETPTENGGRRIFIATDRPISFWEASNRPRSIDYEFTLAEIRLDKDGKGEGKLVPAAKITYKKKTHTIEIENYNIEPVRLADVRVLPPSVKKR